MKEKEEEKSKETEEASGVRMRRRRSTPDRSSRMAKMIPWHADKHVRVRLRSYRWPLSKNLFALKIPLQNICMGVCVLACLP